ncbi:MAG: hypothetical protein IJ175_00735, partial [Clostridia bacterium]|nr:hypothetical protein [Clostridia bacterium]
MTKKIYALPDGRELNGLAHAIESMLTNEEQMDTQVLSAGDGSYIVQGRAQNGRMTQWVGLDKSISVRLTPLGPGMLQAEIGKGEWLKKSLTMATSMFILWPLAVTSTVGMVKQGKLPGKIDRVIQMYLAGIAP